MRMTNPNNVGRADRRTRRMIEAEEKRQRGGGEWCEWIKEPIEAHQAPGDATNWTRDVHTVWKNGWLAVMVRTCRTEIGLVHHATIRSASGRDLNWKEKQRIKNELFGPQATAIEVFPATDRLIDDANLWHLWILPLGFSLPFGLHHKDPCSFPHYRP